MAPFVAPRTPCAELEGAPPEAGSARPQQSSCGFLVCSPSAPGPLSLGQLRDPFPCMPGPPLTSHALGPPIVPWGPGGQSGRPPSSQHLCSVPRPWPRPPPTASSRFSVAQACPPEALPHRAHHRASRRPAVCRYAATDQAPDPCSSALTHLPRWSSAFGRLSPGLHRRGLPSRCSTPKPKAADLPPSRPCSPGHGSGPTPLTGSARPSRDHHMPWRRTGYAPPSASLDHAPGHGHLHTSSALFEAAAPPMAEPRHGAAPGDRHLDARSHHPLLQFLLAALRCLNSHLAGY
ncbi:hypothetical protein NDU88_005123 [Pleurodeles waltl]|uniref:Uncharacterized protein n=1 Tax=Pleurodeles waltl TaxID=8319 RepID=A0AAV7NN20_PLEWA|nr:hypothetical protein NDU88_005123 [Pleurodeles waltl]